MNLKPQDVLVLLKLVVIGRNDWSYNRMAIGLGMSPSEVHSAMKRALTARLAIRSGNQIIPDIRNLEEFIVHGIRYVFVPDPGEMVRGMPTSYAAPPLNAVFTSGNEPPPVWPDENGTVRGLAFSPLYKSVPKAAQNDSKLYELLVLVDAIRGGRAREREFAIKEIKNRLSSYG